MAMRVLRNYGLAALVALTGVGLAGSANADHPHQSRHSHHNSHHNSYHGSYHNNGCNVRPSIGYNNYGYRPPVVAYPGYGFQSYSSNFGAYNNFGPHNNIGNMGGFGVGSYPIQSGYGAYPRGTGFSLYIGR